MKFLRILGYQLREELPKQFLQEQSEPSQMTSSQKRRKTRLTKSKHQSFYDGKFKFNNNKSPDGKQ